MGDFGPLPVSQLKVEKDSVLDALKHGRRVLLSRHGDVVAAIEPPAAEHADLLLHFVTPSPTGGPSVPELTSTEIGQGSPSRVIRDAEQGTNVLITHRGKVYGVLTSPPEPAPLDTVRYRQDAVDKFIESNPSATPEQLADFTESVVAATEGGLSASRTASPGSQVGALMRAQAVGASARRVAVSKTALVKDIATATGQSQAAVSGVLDSLFSTVSEAVANGQKVSIPGWVSFQAVSESKIPAGKRMKGVTHSKLKGTARGN